MVRTLLYILISMVLFGPGDGKKKGRKGNALYEKELYEEAVEEYRLGLMAMADAGPGPIHAGLLNNLGASLYRTGNMEEAGKAFAAAVQMASSENEIARGSYNAGNAAASNKQLEAALAHYRQSLLADPSNQDAKFNYEFVKRKLDEQQQQQQDQKQDQDQNQNNDQENQDQQQQDQEQENQDQQQQQDQQQENQDQQQQDQQQQQEQPDPTKLSQEEAQRILEALENEEEQLLRQVQKMKTRPRRVEKDW